MSLPTSTSLPPSSLSYPSRLISSPSLSSLSPIANSHQLSILHMVIYVSMLLSPYIPPSTSSPSSHVHKSALYVCVSTAVRYRVNFNSKKLFWRKFCLNSPLTRWNKQYCANIAFGNWVALCFFHQRGSSKFKEEHECFSVKELKAQTGKPLGVQTRLDTMGKIEHAQQLARGHLNSFPTKRIWDYDVSLFDGILSVTIYSQTLAIFIEF